jgi:hypothetical protein
MPPSPTKRRKEIAGLSMRPLDPWRWRSVAMRRRSCNHGRGWQRCGRPVRVEHAFKRCGAVNLFADLAHLAERWHAFVAEWNQHAPPFNWCSKSVAKVMTQCERPLALAA